jgi:hypothetical protein
MPGGRTGNVRKNERNLTKTRGNWKINIVILKSELNWYIRWRCTLKRGCIEPLITDFKGKEWKTWFINNTQSLFFMPKNRQSKEGKVFSVHAMKVCRGTGKTPLILNVEHMEVSGEARAPATLHAGEDLQYRLYRKLGHLQSGSGRLEKRNVFCSCTQWNTESSNT